MGFFHKLRPVRILCILTVIFVSVFGTAASGCAVGQDISLPRVDSDDFAFFRQKAARENGRPFDNRKEGLPAPYAKRGECRVYDNHANDNDSRQYPAIFPRGQINCLYILLDPWVGLIAPVVSVHEIEDQEFERKQNRNCP